MPKELNSISNTKNATTVLCCAIVAMSVFALSGLSDPASAAKKLLSEARTSAGGSISTVTTADNTDGKPFIDKCLNASDSYSDYTFNYVQHVSKGSGVTEKGTVCVKKPGMLKCEVKAGPNSGSVAILKDGVVHAHPGGIFKVFTVALKPDDSRLKSANGWPMVESDFSSIWRAMQKYAKDGCPSKVSAEPVSVPSQSMNVLVLEMTKANGQMYKRAFIDPKTTLPVEWWDYVDGKIYAHSNWTDFKGNQGLSETFFTMKGK